MHLSLYLSTLDKSRFFSKISFKLNLLLKQLNSVLAVLLFVSAENKYF